MKTHGPTRVALGVPWLGVTCLRCLLIKRLRDFIKCLPPPPLPLHRPCSSRFCQQTPQMQMRSSLSLALERHAVPPGWKLRAHRFSRLPHE